MRRYADAIHEMSLEDAGSLLKAVYSYDAGGDVPEMSPFVRAIFLTMRADMDEHAERYAQVCERNRRNAQKRWDRQTDASTEDTCGRMPMNATAYGGMRPMPREEKGREKKRSEERRGEDMYISGGRADASASPDMPHNAQLEKVHPLLMGDERERFEKFWRAYPRKESRARAEDAWREIDPDDALTARILAAVEMARESDARFAAQQYTPHPANWLLRREWENEYAVPKTEEVDYGSWGDGDAD